MNNLHEKFNGNLRTLYSSSEMSEVLMHMYVLIELAIIMNADKFKVTPSQILHLDKNGNVMKESVAAPSQLINNMDVFELIVSRDSIVRDHLELITREDNEVIYKIS